METLETLDAWLNAYYRLCLLWVIFAGGCLVVRSLVYLFTIFLIPNDTAQAEE